MAWDGDDRRSNNHDDIMMTIGELKAEAKASQRQREELFSQVGSIKEDIGEFRTEMKEHTATVTQLLTAHAEKHNKQDERIDSLESSRTRLRVVLAGGLGGSGTLGGAIGNWLAKFGSGA